MATEHVGSAGASEQAVRYHYDLGVEFYRLWLDETLTYSCAAWDGSRDLAAAQRAKLDYFLRHCHRNDGKLLDIGCGWGSLLARAAETFGVRCSTGLTLSPQQAEVARRCLPATVDVRLESWEEHDVDEPYATVISIGAFEHFARPGIGATGRLARYRSFFATVHRFLRPRGRLGLQSIAFDQATEEHHDGPLAAFFRDEIFPESMLPRLPEIMVAAEPWFQLERLTCHAADYARTCREWRRRLASDRERATALAGEDVVARYLQYLAGSQLGFLRGDWTLARAILVARVDPLPAADR